jgi:hypothetical protein
MRVLGSSRRLERTAERGASYFVLFAEYQQCDQIKEYEMGATCCMFRGDDKWIQNISRRNLLRIREVPALDIKWQVGYPAVFRVFLSPARQMIVQYLKISHDRFFPHSFQLITHVILTSDAT